MEPTASTASTITTNKFSTLPDPIGDRSVKTLDPPANKPMELSMLFNALGLYPIPPTIPSIFKSHFLHSNTNNTIYCRRWETRLANAKAVFVERGSHQERAFDDVGTTVHRNHE